MSSSGRLLYFVKSRSLWTHFSRRVTTWSPVGAAFNTKTHRKLNLFEKKGVCICFSLLSLFSVLVWELGMIVHLVSIFSTLLANTTEYFITK